MSWHWGFNGGSRPIAHRSRERDTGNPVCRCRSVYLGLKATSIYVFAVTSINYAVTQTQEFKSVKRSSQKCAWEIFNSCKFLSHLNPNMNISQPANLTMKILAQKLFPSIFIESHSTLEMNFRVKFASGQSALTQRPRSCVDVAFCHNVPSGG